MRSVGSRICRAALVLALAGGPLLLAAAPAAAVTAWGLESPVAGSRLVSPNAIPVVAFVEHANWEEIQRVEVRFTRGGEPTGVVRRLDPLDSHEVRPGMYRSRFVAQLDPMSAAWFDFRPAPNGHYALQARAQYAVQGVTQEPTPWSGDHGLVLDVPPPRTNADAAVTDAAARRVGVTWDAVAAGMPDFTRYVVERAGPQSGFETVHEVADSAASGFTDTAPADGDYRYRVTVYRTGAEGAERASEPAPTQVVSVQPRSGSSPRGEPGRGDGEGSPGAGEPGGGGDGQATPPAGSSWRPWVYPTRPPRPPRPAPETPQAPSPRAAAPVEDDTFEEALDYGDWPDEWEVTEREVVRDAAAPERGTLTVFNQELELEVILVPVAAGLVFIMTGFHLIRFLNP